MAKYVKLGSNAASFFDPYSRLSIHGNQVKQLDQKAIESNRVKMALKGGHLNPATEAEFIADGGIITKKIKPEEKVDIETFKSDYGTNAEELLKYYEDNFQVTKKDIASFNKLSLQEMVDELTKLDT